MSHCVVCKIQIIGLCRIFGSKGIYLLHVWHDAVFLSESAHLQHHAVGIIVHGFLEHCPRYLEVREALLFCRPHQIFRHIFQPAVGLYLLSRVEYAAQPFEKPVVYHCQFMDALHRISLPHGFGYDEDTLVGRFVQGLVHIGDDEFLVFHKAVHALPYHPEAFLYGFLESASYGHHLSHRFHAGAEHLVHSVKLAEIPTRNLTDYIVESRLEESRSLFGYRVLQFKQAIAQSQFGSHKGKRISCSLRCQSRRTAQTGIHLYDPVIIGIGVVGILHIAFAHDAYMTYDLYGQFAQQVIVFIAQCLRGSHHYALAGMYAERVEVFHVADSDAIVIAVSHYLIFYFLPAFQRLLHQYLRRERQSLFGALHQLLAVIAESAAQSAKRVCRTDDYRITHFFRCTDGILHCLDSLALYGLYAYLIEFFHKQLPVFGIHYGPYRCAQHFHIVFLEHALFIQFDAAVERSLPSKRQQYAIGSLFPYHFLYEKRGDRQEIYPVGHAFGSLHRSDVGIDKNGFYILLFQGFESLRAGIVKFAGFTYLQCSRTEQQNFLYFFLFHLIDYV